MMSPSDLVERRLAVLQTLVVCSLVVVLLFTLITSAVMLWQAGRVGEQGERLQAVAIETHNSLCALKHDVEARRERAEALLKENPGGIPGIPASFLEQTLGNYDATLQTLRILDCS